MPVLGLSEQLEKELCSNGIQKYLIISKNDKKGRVCLKALHENQWKLIKHNDQTSEEAYESLRKEKEIYQVLCDKKITPKLINGLPFFTTEYVESYTLRQYILILQDSKEDSKEKVLSVIKKVLDNYKLMLKSLELLQEKCEKKSFNEQLSIYLSKLMSSGPDGKHVSGIEKIHNRIWSFYLRRFLIRKHFKNFDSKEVVIHGDFHLNNEIIDVDSNVYIIDFENVIYGSATVELAYWYAQMWVLLYENKEYENILHEEISKILMEKYFEQNLFWKVVSLYKVGISMNSQFCKSERKMPVKTRIELWRDLRKSINT